MKECCEKWKKLTGMVISYVAGDYRRGEYLEREDIQCCPTCGERLLTPTKDIDESKSVDAEEVFQKSEHRFTKVSKPQEWCKCEEPKRKKSYGNNCGACGYLIPEWCKCIGEKIEAYGVCANCRKPIKEKGCKHQWEYSPPNRGMCRKCGETLNILGKPQEWCECNNPKVYLREYWEKGNHAQTCEVIYKCSECEKMVRYDCETKPSYCTCEKPERRFIGACYVDECMYCHLPIKKRIEKLDETISLEKIKRGEATISNNNRVKINEIITKLGLDK